METVSNHLEQTRISNKTRMSPLPEDWMNQVGGELEKSYMKSLSKFLKDQVQQKKIIYPKASQIFRSFHLTPYEEVKVVILGQDPYHGTGQAEGLSFSVPKGVGFPPSLKNIFKELVEDIKCQPPKNGSLVSWAEQGVLLLNTVLTVEAGKAGSHHAKGWELFTDEVIKRLNDHPRPLVFVLWGSPAQKKQSLVTNKKHLVIKAVHPSPLSAHRGFFGHKPFSKINSFLSKNKIKPIDWCLGLNQ